MTRDEPTPVSAVVAAVVRGDVEAAARALKDCSADDVATLRRHGEQLVELVRDRSGPAKGDRARRRRMRSTEGGSETTLIAQRSAEGIELRIVLPANALPASPRADYVTQKTCQDMLGLTSRQFLELLRRDDAPSPTVVGKMRMVRREEMLAYLARLSTKLRRSDDREDEPDGAEAVLREIGCAPARR